MDSCERYVLLSDEYEFVYVHHCDSKQLEQGEPVVAYVSIKGNPIHYEKVDTVMLLPSIKLDDNRYEVVYIME